jgi:hypothetical protein
MQLSSHICVWEGNQISCWTLMSVRTCCWDVRTDATLNNLKLPDTYGHPDGWLDLPGGSLGSDFSNLESAQNLLWTSWSTFLKRNDIPNKMATLHKSNFVKQNAANHLLTNSPFGHSETKITWPVLKIHSQSQKKKKKKKGYIKTS